MRFSLLVFCAVLCAQAFAGPVGQYNGQCAKFCTSNNKFNYEIGHTYEYDYELENLIGTKQGEESRLLLKAKVLITPQSSCDFTMQLRNVVVEGEDGTLATDLERLPLTFAFQDGRIEELCPSAEEKPEILNIKRGILSAMQNSMDVLDTDHVVEEIDVSGSCEADYKIHKAFWGGSVTVIKTKDLNACKDRSSHMAGIHSIGYHADSEYQGLPLMKSQHSCEQVIQEHRLHSSKCEETHTLRPFSSEESGPTSRSTQKLNFLKKSSSQFVPNTPMGEKTTLLFDHLASSEEDEVVKKQAMKLLRELTEESQDEVTPALASKFSQLISTLRKLSFSNLNGVYRNAAKDQTMKKFFMDALPVVGSGAGISMMREVILRGDVSESQAEVWYTSLAFTSKPTTDMLEASLELLEVPAPKQAMLGVSAMLHRFCTLHQSCMDKKEVKAVLKRLESQLGSTCRTTSQDEEDKLMVVLKAIGNAGRTTNENILKQCFMEESNSVRVRVAALEAFRRLPCGSYSQDDILRVFRDVSKDAEIRIDAYLTIMRCPSHQIISEVKEALSSEPINQVGSFVWTHLTNLQETSDPAKQEAKELLSSDFLRNKFNTNALKFSRNYELSLFSEKLNMGSQVESNVIFSKSPVPRSMNYNFTINLFGESLNLFEVGGRVQGVESFLEKFFGPNGYFPEERVAGFLSAMKGQKTEEDDVDHLSSMEVDTRIDGFLRVFGNELAFGSLKNEDDIKNLFGESPALGKMIQELLQKDEIDFTKSSHFINAQFTVPTSSGLPLSLNVNGTALLRLQATKNVQSNWNGFEFSGQIKPSAAVEVTTLMSVEAGRAKSGVQVQSTLHTSTVLDGGFSYKDGKVFNVHLNMPKQRQEIVSLDSKVFIVTSQEKKEMTGEGDNLVDNQICTGVITSKPLGVQLCGELSVNKGFPTNGPAHAAIYLEKTDDFSQYLLELKQEFDTTNPTLELTLDTPNSRVNRKHQMLLNMNSQQGNLKGTLETPFMSFGLIGDYKLEQVKKEFNLIGNANEEEAFSIHGSLNTAQNTRRVNLRTTKPELTVSVYGTQMLSLKGSVDSSDTGKAVQVNVESMFLPEPLTFKSNMNKMDNQLAMNAEAKTPFLTGEVTGYVATDKLSVSGNYKLLEEPTENFEVSGKYTLNGGRDKSFSGSLGLKSSALPSWNTDVEVTGQITPVSVDSRLKIEGPLNMELSGKMAAPSVRDVQMALSARCLKTQSEMSIQFSHQGTSETTTTKLSTHTSNNYDVSIVSSLVHKQSPMHYGADLTLTTPKNQARLDAKIVRESESEIAADLITEFNNENKFKAAATLSTLPERKQVSLMAKLPQSEPLKVEAKYITEGKKVAVLASVDYEGKEYKAEMEHVKSRDENELAATVKSPSEQHTLRLVYADVNSEKRLSFDIASYRQISGKIILSPHSATVCDFEVFWDKANDSTKRAAFKVENHSPTWNVEASFLGRTVLAETTLSGPTFDAKVEWGSGKKIDLKVEQNWEKFKVSLTTPFQGFESQSALITTDVRRDFIEAEFAATWRTYERFGLKVDGKREPTGSFNGQLTVETTTSEALNGLSIIINHDSQPTERKTTCKVLYRGETYESSTYMMKRSNGPVNVVEAKIEVATPRYTATSGYIVEYDQEKFHYKQSVAIPNVYDNDFEVSGKYSSTSPRKYAVALDVTYKCTFVKPTVLKVTVQRNGPQVNLGTTVTHDQASLVDLDVKGTLTSASNMNGKITLTAFDNNFEGAFDHNISVGPTSAISTRIDGQLNGKKVTTHVDGRYTSVAASSDFVVDASLMSPWEAYNDWRINLQHSEQGNRYQTTMTVNKGQESASINQDVSYYGLPHFEHRLTMKTPYEGMRYVNLNTVQKWDDKNFSHNTEGSWNDKNIATSANFGHKQTRKTRKIHGDVNIQTPFTNNIRASLNHEDDGNRYNPVFNVNYGNQNLLAVDATGYMNLNDGNSRLTVTLPNANPVSVNLVYDMKPENKEATVAVEYGQGQKIEFHKKMSKEGELRNVQWYLDANGMRTESHIKYGLMDNKAVGEYYMSSPSRPVIQAKGVIETDNGKHNIDISASYGSQKYELKAKTQYGKVDILVDMPSTHLSGSAEYDLVSKEKAITGFVEVGSERMEFETYLTAGRREGKFKFNLTTPFNGYRKMIVDATYVNGQRNKKVKLLAQKEEQKINLKGKVNLGSTGEVFVDLATPFEGYKSASMRGTYDMESEEKVVYLTGEWEAKKGELSVKGKFTPTETYILSDIRSPVTGKHSLNLHLRSGHRSLNFVGDWNGQRVQVDGSYDDKSFDVTGKMQDKVMSFRGYYDSNSAKLELHSENENVQVSVSYGNKSANLVLRRNSDEIRVEVEKTPTEVSMDVYTPFPEYQSIKFSARYSLSAAEKTATVSLSRNQESLFHGDAQLEIISKKQMKVSALASFPSASNELSAVAEYNMNEKFVRAELGHNGQKIVGEINARCTGESCETTVKFTSPLSGFENVSFKVELGYGEGHKFAKLTTNVNGSIKTCSAEITHGNQNYVIKANCPDLDVDLVLGAEYELSQNEKSAKVSYNFNGYNQEFSVGGRYDDEVAESRMSYNAPGYQRSMTGRVRRGLDFLYTDAVSDGVESNLVEIEGTLGLKADSGKAHLRVKTPFNNWQYFEGLFNYNLKSEMKSFDLELNNGQKTYKLTGEGRLGSNMLEVTLETPFTGYERVSANLEHNLFGERKFAKVSGQRNNMRFSAEANGQFHLKKSEFNVEIALPTTNNRLAASYDFTKSTKEANLKISNDLNTLLEVRGDASIGMSGHMNAHLSLENSKNLASNVEYDFNQPTKTVRVSLTRGNQQHSVEGSLTLRKNELAFELNTSFEPLRNVNGRASYNFTDTRKNVETSVEWGRQKFEVTGTIETQGKSSGLGLVIRSPITNYETIELNSRVVTGARPSMDITFQMPTESFNGKANYYIAKTNGDLMLDITSSIQKLGEMKIEATYDLRSTEKMGEIVFIRNGQTQRGTVKVSYEGTFMNGNAYLKLDTPYFSNVDAEVKTSISPKFQNSEVTGRFGEKSATVQFNMQMQGGYVKLNTNAIPMNLDTNWDLYYSAKEAGLKADLSVNSERQVDLNTKVTYDGMTKVKAFVELTASHVPVQKAEIEWNFSSFKKFSATTRVTCHHTNYEYTFNVRLGGQNGEIRFLSEGNNVDRYDLEADYTLTNGKLNINLRIPYQKQIQLEGYYTAQKYLYDLGLKTQMGDWAVQGQTRLVVNKEFEAKLNLPVEGFERLSALLKLDSQPKRHNLFVELEKASSRITLDQTITTEENKVAYSGNLVTPFQNLESTTVSMSVNFGNDKYGEFTFEHGVTRVNGHVSLTSNRSGETTFTASLNTPFEGIRNANVDASFTYDESSKKPEFTFKFEKEHLVFKVSGHAYATSNEYGAKLSLQTPVQALKDMTFEATYNIERNHRVTLKYKQNDNISAEATGTLFATYSEGSVSLDITTSVDQLKHLSFESSYDFTGTQKHVSARMGLPNTTPIEFDSTWNYGAPTVLKAQLRTPWNQPNFAITIESDLQSTNKQAVVKYESHSDAYELRFNRNVNGYDSSNSISVRTPLPGYESANLKWSVGQKTFSASSEYSGKKIEFFSEYSTDNNVYSLTSSLKTPFQQYEEMNLRAYYKQQNGYTANGSFSWAYNKKVEAELELTDSKVFVKFDSPYSPLKNMLLDAKVETSEGYRFVGTLGWENVRNEATVTIKASSINIDINSPFEPFKQMHLEGELRHQSNEYAVSGNGRWNNKQVQVNGSWMKYEDFGMRTRLQVETPVSGYENAQVSLDVKKPMSSEGVDAKLELDVAGYPVKSVSFVFKHNGPKEVDVTFTVDNTMANMAYKINRNAARGETEITVNGALPIENLTKFSFYGKTIVPDKSNMKVKLELNTPTKSNKFEATYKIEDKDIETELSVDLPSFVEGPVTLIFNIRKESFTNFNMDGVLRLPHKTYETHGSFLMEPTSLKMLFKENGLYNVEAEIDTTFKDGITVDATFTTPRSTHNLNGSFYKAKNSMEIRTELRTPLLTSTVGFKVSASYRKDGMNFNASLQGRDTYQVGADFTASGDRYTGEVNMQISGVQKASINVEYQPMNGMIRVGLPSGNHEMRFSLENESRKVSFKVSAHSPLLAGEYEASCSLKSSKNAHKVFVKATTGSTSHAFTGMIANNENEKKMEAKIDTPLLTLKKIKFSTQLRYLADTTEGEVSLTLPNQVHSLRVSIEKGMNAEFRLNTPWLQSREMIIKTTFENHDYKKMYAEISYNNGEQKVQFGINYDLTDPKYMQGDITLRTNFAGLENTQLKAHLNTEGKKEFQVKLEGGEAYLPNFSLTGSLISSPSLITVEVNASATKRENSGYGFFASLSPNNEERQRLRLTAPGIRYEVTGHVNLYQDKWNAEGTVTWNNKQITGSVEATYDNPMVLRVNIQTPFQGYEHLNYNGKIFWNLERDQTTNRYVAGVEWNEKKMEVRFTHSKNMISAEVYTPFRDYNKFEMTLQCNPTENGKSVRATFVCPRSRWEITAEYNLDSNKNGDFRIECNTPFPVYNFFVKTSHSIKDKALDGHLVLTSSDVSLNWRTKATFTDTDVTVSLEDNGRTVVSVNGKMVPKEKLEGGFYFRMPGSRREYSGKVSTSMRKEGNQINCGLTVIYNNAELFEARLISEDKKVSIKITNPLYPVSVRYTYDNTPTNFEIEGELCWDLHRPVESTLGGNLFLQATSTGAQLRVKVSAPKHQMKVFTTYDLSSTRFDHQLTLDGNMPAWETTVGYGVTLEKMTSGNSLEYVGKLNAHIPNHPYELTGRLTTTKDNVDGKIELHCSSESFLSFNLGKQSSSMYEGRVSLFSPYVAPVEIQVTGDVELGPNYSCTLDVVNVMSTPIRFQASLTGENNTASMSKRAHVGVKFESYSFELTGNAGYNPDKYHGNVEFDLYNGYETVHQEYFAEMMGANKHFRIGKTNDFLLEGRLEPSESGYNGSLSTQIGREEYNANISIHNDPMYVKMDANGAQGNLFNARFDATDVLSTKIYIQPSLVFGLHDVFSDFM